MNIYYFDLDQVSVLAVETARILRSLLDEIINVFSNQGNLCEGFLINGILSNIEIIKFNGYCSICNRVWDLRRDRYCKNTVVEVSRETWCFSPQVF